MQLKGLFNKKNIEKQEIEKLKHNMCTDIYRSTLQIFDTKTQVDVAGQTDGAVIIKFFTISLI